MSLEEYLLFEGTACRYCHFPRPPKGCGLDRISNSIGYTLANCLPCCEECNLARNDFFTVEEMISIIGPAIRRVKLDRWEKEQACTEQK